jgi:hypothetical protein
MALLYALFAAGAVLRRRWAWWLGLLAAVLNGLLVIAVLMEGATIAGAVFWIVGPTILICYLVSPTAREAFVR